MRKAIGIDTHTTVNIRLGYCPRLAASLRIDAPAVNAPKTWLLFGAELASTRPLR
jgi:hypothetical protein